MTTRQGGRAGSDRHVAHLSHELGHAGFNLPTLSAYFWRAPEPHDDLLPLCLGVESARLADAAQLLILARPGPRAKKALTKVKELAGRARGVFEAAWSAEGHREYRSLLRRLDPEGPMPEAPPFADTVWGELNEAVEACANALPRGAGDWVRLGSLTAKVLGPCPGGLEAIPLLHHHLSSMLPHRSLAGLSLDPSCASLEGVAAWHLRVRQRLAAGDIEGPFSGADDPRSSGREADPVRAAPECVSLDLRALDLLVKNPGLTKAQIAERLGCSRGHLYRLPSFSLAWIRLQEHHRVVRKGILTGRSGEGTVDGVDDRKPWQEAED